MYDKAHTTKIYTNFNLIWGIHEDKTNWVDTWADQLSQRQFEPDAIESTVDFCEKYLDQLPSLSEFTHFCEFINEGERN